jgi:hypothetical protein
MKFIFLCMHLHIQQIELDAQSMTYPLYIIFILWYNIITWIIFIVWRICVLCIDGSLQYDMLWYNIGAQSWSIIFVMYNIKMYILIMLLNGFIFHWYSLCPRGAVVRASGAKIWWSLRLGFESHCGTWVPIFRMRPYKPRSGVTVGVAR